MDAASKISVLNYTRANLGTIVYKTMRPGEVDPAPEEKLSHMTALLDDDPALFLSRWGRFLPREQLEQFEGARGDYEVDFHLTTLLAQPTPPPSTPTSPPRTRTTAHIRSQNRRLQYLRRHLQNTPYFDDEAMQLREPALYEHYVGQYIPEEERNAPFAEEINLVERVLSDIDRGWAEERVRREREEAMEEEEEEEEQEEEEEEGEEEEDSALMRENGNGSRVDKPVRRKYGVPNGEVAHDLARDNDMDVLSSHREGEEGDKQEGNEQEMVDDKENVKPAFPSISEEERQELRDEFVRIMEERFLDGEDNEFDYSTVDFNEEYDDMDQQHMDLQDKYFDEDDPDDDEDRGGEGHTGYTGELDY
ncbi:coiled-coil domain-containing protein-domain-containing protein [Jimgerdemannia flammicorona]|uniref:Coiled-coil domain-containing protein-domain-containing protein n=1 Tax=Jimgerdemannia flammicorona TaxID=994334 RepID=A0A433QAV1_9FUNG|nr:coiled-coil domain-containing protein-domain-containing protein [Jimgerdemannia flammicorona]